MMNTKEQLRLKEFRNYVDFLDNSQDIQDHGRFIDTLQALYEDGWFDWIYLYAREQTERVQELEEERDEWKDTSQSYYMTNQELRERNNRYREAIERALGESGWGDEGNALHRTISILAKALEGDDD